MRARQLLAVLAIVVLVGAAGWFVWRSVPRAIENAISTPRESEVDLAMIVTRVRDLNRLETAAMHVLHVSTISQSYSYVPDALSGDTLTFLAAGDVIAGIDLSLLKKDDMYRQADGTVMVRLPPPQILVTRIDNRESKVMARKTGFLRKADVGLEGRARLYAEGGVRNEAVKKGILPLAQHNAEARIADLLHAAGIQKVEFVETTPPALAN
jgi:hypothetical protein